MTARIREFLKKRRESGVDEGPVLVVDLDVVKTNYQNFATCQIHLLCSAIVLDCAGRRTQQ